MFPNSICNQLQSCCNADLVMSLSTTWPSLHLLRTYYQGFYYYFSYVLVTTKHILYHFWLRYSVKFQCSSCIISHSGLICFRCHHHSHQVDLCDCFHSNLNFLPLLISGFHRALLQSVTYISRLIKVTDSFHYVYDTQQTQRENNGNKSCCRK